MQKLTITCDGTDCVEVEEMSKHTLEQEAARRLRSHGFVDNNEQEAFASQLIAEATRASELLAAAEAMIQTPPELVAAYTKAYHALRAAIAAAKGEV